MSKYQLAHEDEHAFTIQEATGHTFKIAKAGLDKKVHQRIKKLEPSEKMNDGGIVGEDKNKISSADDFAYVARLLGLDKKTATDRYQRDQDSLPKTNPENENGFEQTKPDLEYRQPADVSSGQTFENAQNQMPGLQAPQPVMAPVYPELNPVATAQPSIAKEIDPVTQIGKANQNEAQQLQKVYSDHVKAEQDLANVYNKRREAYLKDSDDLMKEIASKKIDPSRVWNDMDTGNKILAGVSMVLGGFASGLTNRPNGAAEVFDKIIDQDIAAQKANLDNKKSLLSMNYQRLGSLDAAETMSRIQANAIVQGQVLKFGAQSAGGKAMPQALLLKQELQAKLIPQIQKMAELDLMSRVNQMGGMSPADEMPYHRAIPGYAEKRVMVHGRIHQARTPENAKYIENLQTYVVPIQNKLEELKSLATLGTRNPFSKNAQKATAVMSELKNLFAKKSGGFQPSHGEMLILEQALDNPTKLSTLFSDTAKYDTVMKGLREELESNYKTKIPTYGGGSLDIEKTSLKR